MRRRQWYRVTRDGTDSESLVGALARAVSILSTEVFTIRNPEVRSLGGPWTARLVHDGVTVHGNDALRLIGDLLDDQSFWCELESNDLDVHVSEEAVYLGISPEGASAMTTLADLGVAAVPDSPYAQDDVDAADYRPATDEFWDDLSSRLESLGSLLLLSQWAGGLGGEQWYLLRNATDVSVVKAGMVPRSILAAFDPSCYIGISASSPAEIERFVGRATSFGNLRWLTPDCGPRLAASVVSDALDLREKGKIPTPGAVLFSWPEADMSGPIMAACPDDNGIVRSSFRFE